MNELSIAVREFDLLDNVYLPDRIGKLKTMLDKTQNLGLSSADEGKLTSAWAFLRQIEDYHRAMGKFGATRRFRLITNDTSPVSPEANLFDELKEENEIMRKKIKEKTVSLEEIREYREKIEAIVDQAKREESPVMQYAINRVVASVGGILTLAALAVADRKRLTKMVAVLTTVGALGLASMLEFMSLGVIPAAVLTASPLVGLAYFSGITAVILNKFKWGRDLRNKVNKLLLGYVSTKSADELARQGVFVSSSPTSKGLREDFKDSLIQDALERRSIQDAEAFEDSPRFPSENEAFAVSARIGNEIDAGSDAVLERIGNVYDTISSAAIPAVLGVSIQQFAVWIPKKETVGLYINSIDILAEIIKDLDVEIKKFERMLPQEPQEQVDQLRAEFGIITKLRSDLTNMGLFYITSSAIILRSDFLAGFWLGQKSIHTLRVRLKEAKISFLSAINLPDDQIADRLNFIWQSQVPRDIRLLTNSEDLIEKIDKTNDVSINDMISSVGESSVALGKFIATTLPSTIMGFGTLIAAGLALYALANFPFKFNVDL